MALNWKVLTGCDVEVVPRRIADAKGDMKESVGGLCRNTFGCYASMGHNVDRSLLAVSNCLKKMFDCEVNSLQLGVLDAL